jgi:hypothetical protein
MPACPTNQTEIKRIRSYMHAYAGNAPHGLQRKRFPVKPKTKCCKIRSASDERPIDDRKVSSDENQSATKSPREVISFRICDLQNGSTAQNSSKEDFKIRGNSRG